jgi:hypothetical protein
MNISQLQRVLNTSSVTLLSLDMWEHAYYLQVSRLPCVLCVYLLLIALPAVPEHLNTSSVTLLSFSPVNDLPNPLNIASLVVQVLQVPAEAVRCSSNRGSL